MKSEPQWLEKLLSFLKLGMPLSITYYIEKGISVTHQVMIRDVICQADDCELVLANGRLISCDNVIGINYPAGPQKTAPRRFSEQEIFKFQL